MHASPVSLTFPLHASSINPFLYRHQASHFHLFANSPARRIETKLYVHYSDFALIAPALYAEHPLQCSTLLALGLPIHRCLAAFL